jgi:hypothetical protein
MKVAFTGRADDLSEAQQSAILAVLLTTRLRHPGEICVGTNGGIGADAWVMELCRQRCFPTWSTDATLRPMPRNRQLVKRCEALIGAPPTEHVLKHGSGTWETIKYGWKYGKKVLVIAPNGRIYQNRDSVPTAPQVVEGI